MSRPVIRLAEAAGEEAQLEHLCARWSDLGDAVGTQRVGLNRIEVRPGRWSTPAHDHGSEEEIFYVMAGRGLAWRDGVTHEIAAGDCLVYVPGEGAHTLHALDSLDVLAFGTRRDDEAVAFPRIAASRVGGRLVDSVAGEQGGIPEQWLREAALGPPELPGATAPRPPWIVHLDDVEGESHRHGRIDRMRRRLSRTAGSRESGLQHVTVAAGCESAPPHCHSLEDEIFVVLEGEGTLVLDSEEHAVSAGSVVGRPAGTGVSHNFQAGPTGLSYLAYGSREPGDLCWYPRSQKIGFRGLGILVRVAPLDYWDGEG